MTAMLDHPGVIPAGWIGEPRLLAAPSGRPPVLSRQQLLDCLDAVGLTGRGGAAFPLAVKIRSLRSGVDPIVVVNATEGEPASAKDHALLGRAPQRVLDGAAVLAGALGASRVLVAVADPVLGLALHRAVKSRPDARLFTLHRVPDRFISGEARALVRALSGGPALPPGRRVLPTEQGVNGSPTVLSNAETFAQLAVLATVGPVEYARIGTSAEPGTTLLTVTGAVARPGVLEVPLGTELAAVAAAVEAAASQAVVIGGYHGAWLEPDPSLRLSRAGLATAGGTLGAGAVMFVGEHTCALAELARITHWLADQSAKQCGPCAFGLPALVADVRALAAGRADPAVADRHAAMVTGRGACAHPDGAARFIRSGLAVLADEIRTHQTYGGCRRGDHGHLTLTRIGGR
jgi:NADH:ubiquinone oxidoreductase subunit F (NADH-binding)